MGINIDSGVVYELIMITRNDYVASVHLLEFRMLYILVKRVRMAEVWFEKKKSWREEKLGNPR